MLYEAWYEHNNDDYNMMGPYYESVAESMVDHEKRDPNETVTFSINGQSWTQPLFDYVTDHNEMASFLFQFGRTFGIGLGEQYPGDDEVRSIVQLIKSQTQQYGMDTVSRLFDFF